MNNIKREKERDTRDGEKAPGQKVSGEGSDLSYQKGEERLESDSC